MTEQDEQRPAGRPVVVVQPIQGMPEGVVVPMGTTVVRCALCGAPSWLPPGHGVTSICEGWAIACTDCVRTTLNVIEEG